MTNPSARIRSFRPFLKPGKGVAILLALAIVASACLAPVAASAGEGGEGGEGGGHGSDAAAASSAASGPATGPGGGGKSYDSAAAGSIPRPGAHASRGRVLSALPLGAPLGWLTRNVSRSLARAAGAANSTGATAFGATLAWLGVRVHAATPDQDRAREAVKKGQIVPLASILKTIQKSVPGDVLKVALVHDVEGSWSYSVTVLTPQGYYRDVNVDAGAGQITQIKEH
jgi:uncharacterized membrane protein YkoI